MIISEGGKITRTGRSAKSKQATGAVQTTKPAKRAKPGAKAKAAPKTKDADAAQACDLCGATGVPVSYSEGNAACEACAAKQNATPAPNPDAVVPRSIADLVRSYAAQMEADQKTPATISGYLNDLGTAVRELGADTLVADLTAKRVAEYFECDTVTLLRSGGTKSQLSIDKTRRVLRLALAHAVALGWIANAPIPEPAKS